MMDRVSWTRVGEVFDRAIELRDEARTTYLDEACAGHPALRREVEELLLAADRPSALLDRPAGDNFSHELLHALDDAFDTVGES